MTGAQILIIAVAAVVALVVIVWGIRSVRSEKDLLEERLVSINSTGQQCSARSERGRARAAASRNRPMRCATAWTT